MTQQSKHSLGFKELISKITGISTPIFGVSWRPEETERKIIRDLFITLEDKRVIGLLCTGFFITPSVLQIRNELTNTLKRLNDSSPAVNSIRCMRAVCREYLEAQEKEGSTPLGLPPRKLYFTFARHIMLLSTTYGIDLHENLSELIRRSPDYRNPKGIEGVNTEPFSEMVILQKSEELENKE